MVLRKDVRNLTTPVLLLALLLSILQQRSQARSYRFRSFGNFGGIGL
jgi:hypothetical protein